MEGRVGGRGTGVVVTGRRWPIRRRSALTTLSLSCGALAVTLKSFRFVTAGAYVFLAALAVVGSAPLLGIYVMRLAAGRARIEISDRELIRFGGLLRWRVVDRARARAVVLSGRDQGGRDWQVSVVDAEGRALLRMSSLAWSHASRDDVLDALDLPVRNAGRPRRDARADARRGIAATGLSWVAALCVAAGVIGLGWWAQTVHDSRAVTPSALPDDLRDLDLPEPAVDGGPLTCAALSASHLFTQEVRLRPASASAADLPVPRNEVRLHCDGTTVDGYSTAVVVVDVAESRFTGELSAAGWQKSDLPFEWTRGDHLLDVGEYGNLLAVEVL